MGMSQDEFLKFFFSQRKKFLTEMRDPNSIQTANRIIAKKYQNPIKKIIFCVVVGCKRNLSKNSNFLAVT
jgi:hypothetical protein